MTSCQLEERLSDLIAFQCVLVALRGVGAEASEEMIWQTYLASLAEQYGFRRVWYGQSSNGTVKPVAVVPLAASDLPDLPPAISESSPLVLEADYSMPVSVEGTDPGILIVSAGGRLAPGRGEQIRLLTSEAVAALDTRRFRARSEEALRQAKLQAESASRAKSLLLANMSHEIRTPMTGVLGFTDLLASTPLTHQQREYVDTIRSSGQALLSLINDILDFSKIEAGRLNLESEPVEIRKLVEKAVGLLAAEAAVKGLRLTFGVDKSAPDTIRGDSMRLRQILVNLLGNAVKFTSEGMVSLTVTGAPDEDGRERITFVVRDSGPGIPAEHQQRIFDSFSQVDPSISRKYGGTGLGLAISRSLAEQMGGSLWVESRPGEGSAFHFTIPAEAVEAIVTPATREQSSPEIELSDMPPLRVIVAEDNPVNRALAVAFLHRLGYHADAAVNGAKLLAALDHTDYDVILMDMQMPEIDGIEATRRVRQSRPAERQPRIIALTAAAFPEDRARCLEAGMDDYVSKPVDLIELAEALRRAGRAMLSAA